MDESLGERFERFLAAVAPDRGGRVSHCEAILGGYSRTTARARVQWRDDTEESFILRSDPPHGSGVFVSDRDSEADLLRSLAGGAAVHTPALRWYDATGEYLGAKCMVIEAAVDPTDLQTLMAQADDIEPLTNIFVDTFAAVHSTPLDILPPSLPRAPDWSSYVDGVLDGYERMADRYPSSAPVLRYVSRWARTHRPPPVPLALTHGDCQPTNVLMTPHGPPLVIDWEFAHIGDPREDLGYYTQNPLQPNVYWADPDHLLTRYRAASGLTEDQLNAEVVEYFLLLGMAKLLEQLFVAADAIPGEQRPGILAPYLINAISHQFDMFLSICDRLS